MKIDIIQPYYRLNSTELEFSNKRHKYERRLKFQSESGAIAEYIGRINIRPHLKLKKNNSDLRLDICADEALEKLRSVRQI